ncbi:hypothetical protein EDD36DRAFT_472183 [Exophiala viscosa]|uniref:DUF6594 domain-containing protein n=1 Tax=Exophiala viscosa TaxID=2486360 RepID=A0AAN6E270_9EURO|nr:hypothetical protein EDD36DRAFT_472183 [Exophiala viscosa]
MGGTMSIDLEKGKIEDKPETTVSEEIVQPSPSDRHLRHLKDGPKSPATDASSSTTLVGSKGFAAFFATLREVIVSRNSRQKSVAAAKETKKYNVRQLHKMPNGYPRVAAFLDSDENFMLYRRFGYLQSRLLLEKQDELGKLECDLDFMDRLEFDEDVRKEVLRTREFQGQERKDLLQKVEKTWIQYSNLVVAARDMTALNKPTSSEYDSLWWWMRDNKPLYAGDAMFVREREDLITLRPGREYASLDAMVEKMLRWLPWPAIGNLFRSKETRMKTEGAGDEPGNGTEGVVYYTRRRIEGVVNTIMICMVLAILIIPVYILFHLSERPQTTQNTAKCIGVLLVSTLAFAAGVSLFSRAKRHEVLAASAGYCALLVVFIGNVGGGHGYGSSFANSG